MAIKNVAGASTFIHTCVNTVGAVHQTVDFHMLVNGNLGSKYREYMETFN